MVAMGETHFGTDAAIKIKVTLHYGPIHTKLTAHHTACSKLYTQDKDH